MNKAALWALIAPQLKRLGKTPNGASEEAGVPDALRNLKRGLGGATYETLTRLAPVLQLPLQRLLDAAYSRPAAPPSGTETQRIRDEMERLRALIAEMEQELQGYQRTLELLERTASPRPPPRAARKK